MESPIFTLDEKTRRPLVQVLVDVALYAFHQGTEAQMEDPPETHEPGSLEDCECPACSEMFYRECYESANEACHRSDAEVARITAEAKERVNAYSVKMDTLRGELKAAFKERDEARGEGATEERERIVQYLSDPHAPFALVAYNYHLEFPCGNFPVIHADLRAALAPPVQP